MKPCRNGALAAGQGPGAERTPWTAPVTLPESSRIPWEWPCLPAGGQACNAGVNSALSPRGGQPERTGVPRDTDPPSPPPSSGRACPSPSRLPLWEHEEAGMSPGSHLSLPADICCPLLVGGGGRGRDRPAGWSPCTCSSDPPRPVSAGLSPGLSQCWPSQPRPGSCHRDLGRAGPRRSLPRSEAHAALLRVRSQPPRCPGLPPIKSPASGAAARTDSHGWPIQAAAPRPLSGPNCVPCQRHRLQSSSPGPRT